jgi:hypothetical protein
LDLLKRLVEAKGKCDALRHPENEYERKTDSLFFLNELEKLEALIKL